MEDSTVVYVMHTASALMHVLLNAETHNWRHALATGCIRASHRYVGCANAFGKTAQRRYRQKTLDEDCASGGHYTSGVPRDHCIYGRLWRAQTIPRTLQTVLRHSQLSSPFNHATPRSKFVSFWTSVQPSRIYILCAYTSKTCQCTRLM